MVDLVRGDVRSYRQLPLNLYQIQSKFRDELRARAGLMRGREFIMKDSYSFHASDEDAKREYQNMYDTYTRIFNRCGLAFRAVEADTGAIGGSQSHEFQVLTETGEDALLACDSCSYAANVEEAKARPPVDGTPSSAAIEKVATPGKKTIEEVSAFLGSSRPIWSRPDLRRRRQARGGAGARRSQLERDQAQARAQGARADARGRQGRGNGHRRAGGIRGAGRAQDPHLLRPGSLRAAVVRVRRQRGGRALQERRLQARLHAHGVRRLPRRRRRRRLPALREGPFQPATAASRSARSSSWAPSTPCP
jgi:hypothetical protein